MNVLVGGKPIRASKESALWCAESIRVLWQSRQNQIAPQERGAAKATFDKAIQRYLDIAAEHQ